MTDTLAPRAIVAPSFAAIFFGNCEKNGLLAIELPQAEIDGLQAHLSNAERPVIAVDLVACRIERADGGAIAFDIDAERRRNLMEGIDHVTETLRRADEIAAFQNAHRAAMPWLQRGN